MTRNSDPGLISLESTESDSSVRLPILMTSTSSRSLKACLGWETTVYSSVRGYSLTRKILSRLARVLGQLATA